MDANAYELVEEVLQVLDDESGTHWSNLQVLNALNRVYKRYFMKMSNTLGDWFVKKSSALSFISGELALPSDCAKPVHLVEVSSGCPIYIGTDVRKLEQYGVGTLRMADFVYQAALVGQKLVMNSSSYAKSVYLWYEQKCRNMLRGTASAGNTGTLTLQEGIPRSRWDDFYNGIILQIIDGTGAGTRAEITDYVGSTGVVSISGTFAADSVYASEHLLPNEAQDAMVWRAAAGCLSSPQGLVLKEEYIRYILDEAKRAETEFFDWFQCRIKNNVHVD